MAPMISRRRMSRCPIFRCFPKSLLSGARALHRNQPKPRCKVAPASECLHRWREGFDRHGRDRSHPRHRLQTSGFRPARGFVSGRLLEFGDLLRQTVDLLEVDARQFNDQQRQRRCRLIDRLHENFYVRGPCGATTPCSARWPRSASISCVRWRTRRSRVRKSMARLRV